MTIIDKIQPDDEVIDVGCGRNQFKKHINKLTGIDPARDEADIKCTIEDFNPKLKFDVALCLGSINFGDYENIANQINKLNDLLHPCARVFWRLNPGQHDHNNRMHNHIPQCDDLELFPWTFDLLNGFAKEYQFEQINCAIDSNGEHTRLYAEWIRGFQPGLESNPIPSLCP